MQIIFPVLILTAIAIVCAIVLTLSNKFFGVEENEKATVIRDCLPGANCGACGYSGCDGYAAALAEGTEKTTNLCVPGGKKTADDIAEILEVESAAVVEQVAYVACNGVCGAVERKCNYNGKESCAAANLLYNGDKACIYACLGYGDCAKVCPQDAIYIENGIANIDNEKCIGCGICVRKCPNSVIKLIDRDSSVAVKCSNHDKGALTRKYCSNGCIGCMKCQKICPHGAIKVIDNLATIDYSLCTSCGECVKVCPVHCIHEDDRSH